VAEVGVPELIGIMRACAGEDESVNLDGDITDVPFADLGYDSLALLETVGRLEREYRVKLADDLVAGPATPREFLVAVNAALASATAV
jgi:act minimal PKS acyl carrier protein